MKASSPDSPEPADPELHKSPKFAILTLTSQEVMRVAISICSTMYEVASRAENDIPVTEVCRVGVEEQPHVQRNASATP